MYEKVKNFTRFAESRLWNILHHSGLYNDSGKNIHYIAENANWAIRWEGEGIERGLKIIPNTSFEVRFNPTRSINRVVHFGSQYVWGNWAPYLPKKNTYAVSFFHGKRSDGPAVSLHIDKFLEYQNKADRIITANTLVEKRLLNWGVEKNKVVKIPIGIDVDTFHRKDEKAKLDIRKILKIPNDVNVIGSFQKDGNGWGKGLTPKLIKGPDIFLSVVEKLAKQVAVHVLLTGPARGYVMNGLRRIGVPFTHRYPKSVKELASLYNALDLYMITSREEGGPKGLLEGMASGVPVVSTNVGMASDLLVDNTSGGVVPVDNVEQLVIKAGQIIRMEKQQKETLIRNARENVLKCDWKVVARNHWENVYLPLLEAIESK